MDHPWAPTVRAHQDVHLSSTSQEGLGMASRLAPGAPSEAVHSDHGPCRWAAGEHTTAVLAPLQEMALMHSVRLRNSQLATCVIAHAGNQINTEP